MSLSNVSYSYVAYRCTSDDTGEGPNFKEAVGTASRNASNNHSAGKLSLGGARIILVWDFEVHLVADGNHEIGGWQPDQPGDGEGDRLLRPTKMIKKEVSKSDLYQENSWWSGDKSSTSAFIIHKSGQYRLGLLFFVQTLASASRVCWSFWPDLCSLVMWPHSWGGLREQPFVIQVLWINSMMLYRLYSKGYQRYQ